MVRPFFVALGLSVKNSLAVVLRLVYSTLYELKIHA